MDETADTIEREAVRAIILTPERELLLLRVQLRDPARTFWITPGGGMDRGESPLACLQRELREELGLERFALGPLIWRREHTFDWAGRRVHQREHYHVLELPKFAPVMTDPDELLTIAEMRWWTQRELADTREGLTPLRLPAIVTSYLRDGAPADPGALPFVAEP